MIPRSSSTCLAMFADLASRYPLTSMMADKIPQTTLELDGFGGRIDPLLRMAGSICFCEHCLAQAQKDGVDLKAAQRMALELGEASRKIPQHVREALKDDLKGDTEIPLFLIENPLFADVLRWRMDCVVRFLATGPRDRTGDPAGDKDQRGAGAAGQDRARRGQPARLAGGAVLPEICAGAGYAA